VHGPTPLGCRPTPPHPFNEATTPTTHTLSLWHTWGAGSRGRERVETPGAAGCPGAQGWTPSPPIRPHFCPPLRPHLEQSAAADSAPTATGPTPTTNWPSRCTRRTRKGGARQQACVAGHLRSDVRRFGDEQGRDSFRAWDLLPSFCGFAADGRAIASVGNAITRQRSAGRRKRSGLSDLRGVVRVTGVEVRDRRDRRGASPSRCRGSD
jgi:hypothetical protein